MQNLRVKFKLLPLKYLKTCDDCKTLRSILESNGREEMIL